VPHVSMSSHTKYRVGPHMSFVVPHRTTDVVTVQTSSATPDLLLLIQQKLRIVQYW